MVFSVLIVGEDKVNELKQLEATVNACKKYVGPIKVLSTTKAHEAVSHVNSLASACGRCDVAMLSHHFTAPGKQEFSDALRKVLKEKHPDAVVVCWGHPDKGGKKGEHYHFALEDTNPAAVGDCLSKIKNGEIVADYGGKGSKGGKGAPPRKSIDAGAERRKSLDSDGAPGMSSSPSMRRKSDVAPAMMGSPSLRRKSMEEGMPSPAGRKSFSLWDDGMGGASMGNDTQTGYAAVNNMGRSNGVGGMMAAMPSMARTGSLNGTNPMLTSMGSMGGMSGMNGMGMSGMGSMGGMGTMDMGSMGGMGGMGGMNNMGSMGPMAGMAAMAGISSLNHVPTMARSASLTGMNPMASMMPMMNPLPAMPGMTPMVPMTGMTHMNGLTPMSGMIPMASPLSPMIGMTPIPTSPTLDMPQAAAAPAASGGNTDLVRLLTDEVSRLRKAVEEKKIRQSLELNAGALPQHMAQVVHSHA